MSRPLILASSSATRLKLLRAAGLQVTPAAARIDEVAIRLSLEAEGAKPHDIADALAEFKAQKISDKNPDSLILGCDQILECDSKIFTKPETIDQARTQLSYLRGKTHRLLSAAVIYDQNKPVWRHLGVATMTMREFSADYLDSYLVKNWPNIGDSVGGYKLESEGVRLFSKVGGDYFSILGLPLLPILGYLGDRGFLQT